VWVKIDINANTGVLSTGSVQMNTNFVSGGMVSEQLVQSLL